MTFGGLCSTFFILLRGGTSPRVTSLVKEVLEVMFLYYVVSKVEVVRPVRGAYVGPFLGLFFVLVSRVMSISRLFGVYRL